MSDNNNCGDFIPTEDFPDFIIDPWVPFQILGIIISCYFNRRGLRFTRREMRYEFVRYISFYRFPSSSVGIHEFIRAGFYYSGDQDFVICNCCGYRRGNWQETDNPNDIHRQFSPNCIFFRQQPTENIQINETLQYLREYLRQNPTGPIYLSASSITTTFSYRESQQTEGHEIIRRLPQADLPGPPINCPLVTHNGPFDLRSNLIRNPMIEMENRDQSQVHGELVNQSYEQSNPLSSEGFPALMYRNNHSQNSVTYFGQVYENRQSNQTTGDHSDSSQDTTALKTVFEQETESSDAVEKSTNLSQHQNLIKRTSRASSRLSSEGLHNGDVIQTVLKKNKSYQETTDENTASLPNAELQKESREIDSNQETNQEGEANRNIDTNQKTEINQDIRFTQEIFESNQEHVTDIRTVPMANTELHKESEEIDSNQETNQDRETSQDENTHQATETNHDIRLTKEVLETPEDPIIASNTGISISRIQTNDGVFRSPSKSGNSRNLAPSTEPNEQESDEYQGFVELALNHTSTYNGYKQTEQRIATGRSSSSMQVNSSSPAQPGAHTQNRSPVHSIQTKETDRFELRRDAEQSDTYKDGPGLNYTIHDMPSLENEGRLVTNVSSTADIGLEEENNNTVSVHTLKANRTELRQQPYKIQNSDLKIDTKGFDQVEEVTEERTVPKAEAKLHIERQEMQSNQDREAHMEIPNIQRTENNKDIPADLGFNHVQVTDKERTAPMAKAELHKESEEVDSNQETNQERETNQDLDTHQATETNQDKDIHQVTETNKKIRLTKEVLGNQFEKPEDPITAGNKETRISRKQTHHKMGRSTLNSGNSRNHAQTIEPNDQQSEEQPDFDLTLNYTSDVKGYKQTEQRTTSGRSLASMQSNTAVPVEPGAHSQNLSPRKFRSVQTNEKDRSEHRRDAEHSETKKDVPVPTLENEGSSFTDECAIIDLGIDKENYKVVPVHFLQANISGLTKQPQKLEARIDETEHQVVSEVGNTRTIFDDRKPSRTFRSLPNKLTNASAQTLNQSRKCKSLENNGKQADIKSKSRNLNQNGQPLVSARGMRSLAVESGPQTGNRSPRPVYPIKNKETEHFDHRREAEQSDTINTILETAGAAYQSITILELKRQDEDKTEENDVDETEENDPQYSQDTPSAYNVEMRSMKGATGQFEENGNVEERINGKGRRSGKGFQSTVKNEKVTQAGQEKRVQHVNDIHMFEVNHEQNNLQEEEIMDVNKFMSELYKNLMKREDEKEREALMKELLEISSM